MRVPVSMGRISPLAAMVPWYLFLGRPEAAERSYQEAIDLEPRPEGYLNLGRAQWLGGRKEEALRSFGLAVKLDPLLARELPPGAGSP